MASDLFRDCSHAFCHKHLHKYVHLKIIQRLNCSDERNFFSNSGNFNDFNNFDNINSFSWFDLFICLNQWKLGQMLNEHIFFKNSKYSSDTTNHGYSNQLNSTKALTKHWLL